MNVVLVPTGEAFNRATMWPVPQQQRYESRHLHREQHSSRHLSGAHPRPFSGVLCGHYHFTQETHKIQFCVNSKCLLQLWMNKTIWSQKGFVLRSILWLIGFNCPCFHFQSVAEGRDTIDYVLHPIGNDSSMAVVKIAAKVGGYFNRLSCWTILIAEKGQNVERQTLMYSLFYLLDSDKLARKEHYLHGSRLLLTLMPKQVVCTGIIQDLTAEWLKKSIQRRMSVYCRCSLNVGVKWTL